MKATPCGTPAIPSSGSIGPRASITKGTSMHQTPSDSISSVADSPTLPLVADEGRVNVRLPPKADAEKSGLDQDEEWCEVEIDGRWKRIRFHDYHEVFGVPGLYEALFAERLECRSPSQVVSLLEDALAEHPEAPRDLRVLDVGAGNGMVGEELRRTGVEDVMGIDIIPEARIAAERDREGTYRDYLVADLTALDSTDRRRIESFAPNCLTVVAALGYGDIPTEAFLSACSFIPNEGWIAFNIKEDFLVEGEDRSGFSNLVRTLQREGALEVEAMRRYRHRLSVHGVPLRYVAFVGRKRRPFGRVEPSDTAADAARPAAAGSRRPRRP
jgi:SAM-dependent methyltransferase